MQNDTGSQYRAMHPDNPPDLLADLKLQTFDDALGRRIIETHIWAVREGLRGAAAYELFDGYCQRLVIDGTPLWRAHTGDGDAASAMERLRLHLAARPQRHRARAICARQTDDAENWLSSPFYDLIRRAQAGEDNPSMRRRLEAGPEQRDFPVLEEFFAAGATDYVA